MKFFVLLILLASCFNRSDSPEGAITDFVNARLDKIISRDYITERTTGKMKLSIESMSDEEFSQFSNLKDYKRDSFKIISKSCQEKKCYVTYSIGYRQAKATKTGWNTEVKKIAEVNWLEGKWLISDVTNLKTYHETSDSIDVTP
jgi:hypothetical protein